MVREWSSDELTEAFEGSAIASGDTEAKPLTTKVGGCIVPQSALFDLKTRSIKRQSEDHIGEQLPRLWITMVPNIVLAFHAYGKFESILVQEVQSRVDEWESANTAPLGRFGALLNKIVSFAREDPGRRFEFEFNGSGDLHVREVGGKFLLSSDGEELLTASQPGDIGKPLPTEISERWVS